MQRSSCDVTAGNGIQDAGSIAIANSLSCVPLLQLLNLWSKHRRLVTLQLLTASAVDFTGVADNEIEDAGATAIACSLSSVLRLQTLDMGGRRCLRVDTVVVRTRISASTVAATAAGGSDNSIGTAGAAAIAGSLSSLPHLQVLSLERMLRHVMQALVSPLPRRR